LKRLVRLAKTSLGRAPPANADLEPARGSRRVQRFPGPYVVTLFTTNSQCRHSMPRPTFRFTDRVQKRLHWAKDISLDFGSISIARSILMLSWPILTAMPFGCHSWAAKISRPTDTRHRGVRRAASRILVHDYPAAIGDTVGFRSCSQRRWISWLRCRADSRFVQGSGGATLAEWPHSRPARGTS
jgi:hypothetical protein